MEGFKGLEGGDREYNTINNTRRNTINITITSITIKTSIRKKKKNLYKYQ